jgi:glycosyltransferase involved in cell wall biosynthesis
MNILFSWGKTFKNGGGVGRVTEVLAEQFLKEGHSVDYFSFSKGDPFTEDGINHYFSSGVGKVYSDVNIDLLAELLIRLDINVIINQSGFVHKEALKALNRAINKAGREDNIKIYSVHHNCIKCLYKHFELVVKNNFSQNRFYPVIRNPLVMKLLKLRHKKKYASYIRYAIESSEKLVLLSEKYIPDLEVYLGYVPESGVKGILNPAPFKMQNTESEKKDRLVHVGRINFQQKRTDLLIPVWKEIMKKHPGWELDVVGDGEGLPELKKMAENAGLERIHFHGYQDPKPFIRKAKYFLMTSAFEGFPMVLVEAQAYGVVPIAFNSFSALSDIVEDGVNGVTVTPFDISEYIKKLDLLMESDEERLVLSENARSSIEKCSPEKITTEWMDLFQG